MELSTNSFDFIAMRRCASAEEAASICCYEPLTRGASATVWEHRPRVRRQLMPRLQPEELQRPGDLPTFPLPLDNLAHGVHFTATRGGAGVNGFEFTNRARTSAVPLSVGTRSLYSGAHGLRFTAGVRRRAFDTLPIVESGEARTHPLGRARWLIGRVPSCVSLRRALPFCGHTMQPILGP